MFGIDNNVGGAGAKALADALRVNQTLDTLDLFNARVDQAGVAALAEALKVNQYAAMWCVVCFVC